MTATVLTIYLLINLIAFLVFTFITKIIRNQLITARSNLEKLVRISTRIISRFHELRSLPCNAARTCQTSNNSLGLLLKPFSERSVWSLPDNLEDTLEYCANCSMDLLTVPMGLNGKLKFVNSSCYSHDNHKIVFEKF